MTVPVHIHTLGAGSEVGRSCFIITISDVSVLVDAGVHLKPQSKEDRTPVLPEGIHISAAFITHYHLDHIGSLPYLTEVAGTLPHFDIYMSYPTKALAGSVLVDYSKGPNSDLYCTNHALRCIYSDRIKTFSCGEEIRIRSSPDFLVQTVYAGHVVGGVMLMFKYRGASVVYTGDFSVVPDSLLRPISIPRHLVPRYGVDVVITESTHCTTVTPRNKSQISIESEICRRIASATRRGGRVLIPIFAVGRTQEFASIIRQQLGSSVRLYTTSPGGYKTSLLSETVSRQWLRDSENFDDLYNVEFLKEGEALPEQAVVFASPAMIEGGSSLKLFLSMCEDERNLVILTGYCNKDTAGNSVILFASRNVSDRRINIHGRDVVVNAECFYSPFSGHTDRTGIIQVLSQLRPRHAIVLVHGQRDNMERFREQLKSEGLFASTQIAIPTNYEVLRYNIPTERAVNTVAVTTNACVVRRRVANPGTVNHTGVEERIKSHLPHVSVTKVSETLLHVSEKLKGVVTVEVCDSFCIVSWTANSGLGPHWIAFNPLVDAIIRALLAGSDDVDKFSISDISD